MSRSNNFLVAAGLVIFSMMAPAGAAESADSSAGWAPGFSIAPYGWIAGFDGEVGSTSTEIDPGGGLNLPRRVDVTTSGDLDQIGFMSYGEWRGDRWYGSFDFVWFDVGQDGNIALAAVLPASTARAEIAGNVYQLDVGYRLTDSEQGSIALYGGVRYYNVDVTLTAQGGLLPNPAQSNQKETWADAVVGARWSYAFGDRWNLFALTDFGVGESDTSWQILSALGYEFDWGSLNLGYRFLSIDFSKDDYLIDIDLAGPLFGAAFHF